MKRQTFATNSNIPERQEFQIVKRTPRDDVKGIKIEGREFRFGQGNMTTTDDPGLAREIHYTQGQGGSGDVVVVPVEKKADRGHVRTFVIPPLPWHKEKTNG